MVASTQEHLTCKSPYQVDRERCLIEGVVDGLTPGFHGLAIHETGDVSRFNLWILFDVEQLPTNLTGVAQV